MSQLTLQTDAEKRETYEQETFLRARGIDLKGCSSEKIAALYHHHLELLAFAAARTETTTH